MLEPGFELQEDTGRKLVQGRCWGFWELPLAERFQREALEGLRRCGRPSRLLLDMTEMMPQRDDTQQIIRQLMVASAQLGLLQAAIVTTNAITKLQLARLTREAATSRWALVPTLAQAQQRLGL